MDQFDRASELEQIARDKAIAHQRSKTAGGQSLERCAECGEVIPPARRLAIKGVKTCIDCQHFNEKQGKLYGAR